MQYFHPSKHKRHFSSHHLHWSKCKYSTVALRLMHENRKWWSRTPALLQSKKHQVSKWFRIPLYHAPSQLSRPRGTNRGQYKTKIPFMQHLSPPQQTHTHTKMWPYTQPRHSTLIYGFLLHLWISALHSHQRDEVASLQGVVRLQAASGRERPAAATLSLVAKQRVMAVCMMAVCNLTVRSSYF